MHIVTISQINEKLKRLSADKLILTLDFISYLVERDNNEILFDSVSKTINCMYASEEVLAKDWNLPSEDKAWVNL